MIYRPQRKLRDEKKRVGASSAKFAATATAIAGDVEEDADGDDNRSAPWNT
jgi:hypothetical protein